MTRVTTFTASPDTLLPTELNNIQDDAEELLEQRHILHEFSSSGINTTQDRYVGLPNQNHTITASVAEVLFANCWFWYDPAQWKTSLLPVRKPRLMLRAVYHRGSTTAGTSISVGLRRIQNAGGSTAAGLPRVTDSVTFTALTFSPSDASGTVKTTTAFDMSGEIAGPYAVRLIVTGTHSGLSWNLQGQVLAWTQE